MTEWKCKKCGNFLSYYHGLLGYEALECKKCGFTIDVHGEEYINENIIGSN